MDFPVKTLKAADIRDPRDRKAIINLWSSAKVYVGFQTRVCGLARCSTMDCTYSHIKIMGYPAVRCSFCSTRECGDDKISYRTVRIARGKTLELYSVCRRVAWEFEDQEILAKSYFKISTRAKSHQPNHKRPALRHLSPTELRPAAHPHHYVMSSLEEPSDPSTRNEDREQPKTMIKRKSMEDGGMVIYYFRSTSSTKRALISLVSADDFRGQVKISERHLQKAILKLSDEEIVSVKAELEEVPGASVVIERAELRLRNAKLEKLLDQIKK